MRRAALSVSNEPEPSTPAITGGNAISAFVDSKSLDAAIGTLRYAHLPFHREADGLFALRAGFHRPAHTFLKWYNGRCSASWGVGGLDNGVPPSGGCGQRVTAIAAINSTTILPLYSLTYPTGESPLRSPPPASTFRINRARKLFANSRLLVPNLRRQRNASGNQFDGLPMRRPEARPAASAHWHGLLPERRY